MILSLEEMLHDLNQTLLRGWRLGDIWWCQRGKCKRNQSIDDPFWMLGGAHGLNDDVSVMLW